MKFTVADLRKLLEGQPDDASVFINMPDGCCGDKYSLEVSDAHSSIDDIGPTHTGYVTIECEAVPGFKSCIQASGTYRSDELYWRRGKTFMENVLAGKTESILQHLADHKVAYDKRETRLSEADWLGMTQDELNLFKADPQNLLSILRVRSERKERPGQNDEHLKVLDSFSKFRHRLRNTLMEFSYPAVGMGWFTEEELLAATKEILSRKAEKGDFEKPLTLKYLRREAKEYKSAAKLQRKEAAKEADSEKWHMASMMDGQAMAYQSLIGYLRGLTARQYAMAVKKKTL